ncbi:MAG: site-2 protease family protein [Candidatus Hermodarchaeota archaeon]
MSLEDVFGDIFLNPWFIISAIFWLIVAILAYFLKDKKDGIMVFFPILALMKTKKLNNFIKKIARKAPRFWRIFWTIGIFVSFSFTIFAFFFFFINMINLIFNPRIENAVTPLIPGVTVSLPIFMYLILPILFVMTTHEFAHGIAASTDGVEVKSTGILGAGLFYLLGMGAFVEVDEREMNSTKFHRNTRLRIASAGTFVNAITAAIAFLLILNFSFLISPVYGAQAYQVDTVLTEEQGGFNENNLEEGDVIRAVKEKGSKQDFTYLDGSRGITLSSVLENDTKNIDCSVGDELTLKIYRPTTGKFEEKDIELGPRYKIGIIYEYPSNTELKITHILSKEEDGNNYNRGLEEDLIITKINGTKIDVEKGKTLEKFLTDYNITRLKLTTPSGQSYKIKVELDGVFIGVLTKLYWMPKNEIGEFFGGDLPDFIIRELLWLWIIAFSVTIFNMLPLPIFDGDRIVKELVNWKVGEEYIKTKKKSDKIVFKKEEKDYGLSEYRVEKIDSVKIIMEEPSTTGINIKNQSEIIVNEDKYSLIDKIGDGFKSTISFNFPEEVTIKEDSIIHVSYEYWYDEKKPKKKMILNAVRIITLFVVLANFILSFVLLGVVTFWI